MKRLFAFCVLCTSLAVLLCIPLASPSQLGGFGPGDPRKGQALFVEKECVLCHAVRGEGGRRGPDLGRKAVKGSFFEIAAGMWNHSVSMQEKMREFRVVQPSFGGNELADLVAFLYFLNYFDEPGDPEAGAILFTQKHCIVCHRVEGVGGTVGPSMENLARGTSSLKIAQDLWNHGSRMVLAMRQRGLEIPKFEGSEIVDLFAYLRIHGKRGDGRQFQAAGDPERGRRLFRSKGCGRCHGIFGKEDEVGPDLGLSPMPGSVTQIAGRMWNHWPEMAGAMGALGIRQPRFEREELADLLAYIFVSRYDGQSGDAERGKSVYTEKGCAFCHSLDGSGGIGPDLRDLFSGKEDFTQRMWNHAPGMWRQMGDHQIPWPRFEARELADLLAFLLPGDKPNSSETEAAGSP